MALKRDYQDIRVMFFAEPPDFEAIMARLEKLAAILEQSQRLILDEIEPLVFLFE